MRETTAYDIPGNLIERIAKQWFLITAGTLGHCNTMTANWGGAGYLWMKPVIYVFIRPERHTYGFVEREAEFTVSFLPESCRAALNWCGSHSGRDGDKIAAAGLTAFATPGGGVGFREAELTLECRKLYSQMLDPEGFVDREILEKWYAPGNGLHRLYVAEIVRVLNASASA